MDGTNVSFKLEEQRDNQAIEAVVDLNDIQLMIIGGGVGEIIVG